IEANRIMIKSILGGVQTISELDTMVITKGYLNLAKTLQLFHKYCQNLDLDIRSKLGRLEITKVKYITSDDLNIQYNAPKFGIYELVIFDFLGKTLLTKKIEYNEYSNNEIDITLPYHNGFIVTIQSSDEIAYKKIFKIK
nr:hypothetical protein [Saprospiraceae bacterium]